MHFYRRPPHTRWSAILFILLDIMNFGEQFVLHTVITSAAAAPSVQDKTQKIFIFTILVISALSLLKTLFDDER